MNWLELKIPPAVSVILFAIAMWVISFMNPGAVIHIPAKEWAAGILWLAGFALISVAAVQSILAKTTVNPMTPGLVTSIVATGIYRLSWNPMYVGFLLMLAAWDMLIANVLSVLLLPLFVVYLNRFQIILEENALLAKFGDDYASYLKSVRRWVWYFVEDFPAYDCSLLGFFILSCLYTGFNFLSALYRTSHH